MPDTCNKDILDQVTNAEKEIDMILQNYMAIQVN
jgi:hypothetical protein